MSDSELGKPITYTHIEDGGSYHVVGSGLMKVDADGSWVPAIAYEDVSSDGPHAGRVYYTSNRRWNEKFKHK